MKFKHWKEAQKRANELKPLIEALSGEITAAEAEARKEELTVEERGEIIGGIQAKVTERDELTKEFNEAQDAEKELRAAEERQFNLVANLGKEAIQARQERTGQEEDVYATRSYELAWAKYIKTGNDAEVRDLISTQSQGILVPRTLVNKIEDTVRKGGRILALCDITAIKGITEYPIAGTRTDPELHDETGAASKKEKSIDLTSVSMEPQFIAEILRTSRKFEADSISAFWDWLMAELPDALKRVIDRKILTGGQGAKDGIHGILTNANPVFVATLEDHVLNFNTANQVVALLDDGVEDNTSIVMNRKTFFNNVMGLVGTDGHPIWQQIMTSNLTRPAFMMGGFPVVFSNELPAYDDADAGDTYMVAGDFKAFKVNFPLGMQTNIIKDELTEMENNIIRYLSEIYVAGNITRLGSFAKVTK